MIKKWQNKKQIDKIVEMTKCYSGADLRNLCAEASLMPIREAITEMGDISMLQHENLRPTNYDDFQIAIKQVLIFILNFFK